MNTTTALDPRPASREHSTYAGMLAVAVAGAVLSFSALAGLAELAGVTAVVQPDDDSMVPVLVLHTRITT